MNLALAEVAKNIKIAAAKAVLKKAFSNKMCKILRKINF